MSHTSQAPRKIMFNIPPTQTPVQKNLQKTPQSSHKQPKSSNAQTKSVLTGDVISVQEDFSNRSWISRWIDSLKGRPYCQNGSVFSIQVTDPNRPNKVSQIIVYGKMMYGSVITGNRITAYGKYNSNGQFVSKLIHNDSTGVEINIRECISPNIIRLLTLIPFVLLLCIIASGLLISVIRAIIWVGIAIVLIFLIVKLFPIFFLRHSRNK